MSVVLRGDIFFADLSPIVERERAGIRPVVVVQNNIGNKYSPMVIVAPITSLLKGAKLPTHVEIKSEDSGLNSNSVLLLEQIRVLDKRQLKEKISNISEKYDYKINKALSISLALESDNETYKNSSNLNAEEIAEAINILKKVARNFNFKFDIEEEKRYKEDLKNMYNKMDDLHEKFDKEMKPLLKKYQIARGILNEHMVIDYFNKIKRPRYKQEDEDLEYNYKAEKGDAYLDHLKIDVVAKNKKNKIFVQVKGEELGSKEIEMIVKKIKNLDDKIYNKEGLQKVACICSSKFPQDIELQRFELQERYEIPIMCFHKYQILQLSSCKIYKRVVN